MKLEYWFENNDSADFGTFESEAKTKKEATKELRESLPLWILPRKIKEICNRVQYFNSNRCIHCGAKSGQKCELK